MKNYLVGILGLIGTGRCEQYTPSFFGRFDYSGKNPTADWPGSRVSVLVKALSSTTNVNFAVESGYDNYLGLHVNCEFISK